jgi:hypothetical protein
VISLKMFLFPNDQQIVYYFPDEDEKANLVTLIEAESNPHFQFSLMNFFERFLFFQFIHLNLHTGHSEFCCSVADVPASNPA